MQRISITNPQNIIDGTAKKYYFKLRNTGGPKGDKGDKGDTGAQGPQGPQGDPCTVVVNSTATLEPGSNAYVTNTGSLSNAVLNFGIPKGDRGPQGAKGDKGDTGAQGETGPRGPQGERGTNATVYVGTTSTLNPGSQATVYNSGSDSNAVLNFGIPKGEKGDTGSQGPQGPTGQNFAPTIVAELPATGDSSKLYLTPKAHTTQTATGNPITATVAEDAGAIESFQLDGNTEQDTLSGKNLAKLKDGTYSYSGAGQTWNIADGVIRATRTNKTHQGGSINIATGAVATWAVEAISDNQLTGSGGTYTLTFSRAGNVTPSSTSTARACIYGFIYDDNGGNTSGNGQLLVDLSSQSSGTYTLNLNAGKHLGALVFYSQFISYSDVEFKVQLEAGSTATDFEPYVGGVPSPNPDYPQAIQTVTGEQTVEIVGKNLFDKTKVTNGYYIDANGALQPGHNFGYSDYIAVAGGETYSYSGATNNVSYAGKCAWYNSNKEFISSDGFGFSGQLTAPANASYFRTTIRIAESPNQAPYLDTYQLELGSTATAYAPYSKQTLPLDLGSIELCKLGTYQDYIYKSGSDWKVHKATNKTILDGSSDEGWILNTAYPTEYMCNKSNVGITAPSGSTASMCSAFIVTSVAPATKGKYRIGGSYLPLNYDNGDGGVDAFKTWLAQHNMTIYAALATPTDTTITDQTLIAQLEAVRTASLQASNTITNTATGSNLAGDMEIGYYGYNPRNRYDKWLWLDINNEYEQIGS